MMDWIVPAIQTVIMIVAVGLFIWYRDRLPFGADTTNSDELPQHLNVRKAARLAERITDASVRVLDAKERLEAAQSVLTDAALGVRDMSAPDPALAAWLERTKQDIVQAKETLELEEYELAQLLNSRESGNTRFRSGLNVVLQYVIFGTLAWFVLIHLMNGITNSPPAGTTPRTLITFLITVVTVGIALILVLATIVSNSEDRERRFSQGKEVLTALLGVLGTIVGFYFGSSADEVSTLSFDPIVVSREDHGQFTVTTSIRSGKAPYSYEISFPKSDIRTVLGKTSGKVAEVVEEVNIPSAMLRITAVDSNGRTGLIEYDDVRFRNVTPTSDENASEQKKKSNPSPPSTDSGSGQ